MVTVLLLQVMGDGKVGAGLLIVGFGWGDRGWVSYFFYFLFCLSLVILSLPLLGLGSKSTSLSPGFCVRRPSQYNTICWEFGLFSESFVSSWMIVWADGVNGCGWCLAGGMGC